MAGPGQLTPVLTMPFMLSNYSLPCIKGLKLYLIVFIIHKLVTVGLHLLLCAGALAQRQDTQAPPELPAARGLSDV